MKRTLLFFFFLLSLVSPAANALTELHAHAFMKLGLGPLFHGDFNGPLLAKKWSDRWDSQVNVDSLQSSGIRVLVVSLYAHPLFASSKESIRKQIKLAQDFVRDHPEWIIAKSGSEALRAYQAGKRILILSLEGASGILDSDEDIQEFVDQLGIRIVTLLHLTDDYLGGVAFHHGVMALASPVALARSWLNPKRDQGVRVNDRGLTPQGRKLAGQLVSKKVWIDLAHSSDQAQSELRPILREAHQPLLYTHTMTRDFIQAERGISPQQLKEVKNSGGIVGAMPSQAMLVGTQIHPKFCPKSCTCDGGVAELATQYEKLVEEVGVGHVVMGSDWNGSVDHLKPSCGTRTELDLKPGFYHIGQTPILWQALKNIGATVPSPLDEMDLVFLRAWAKLE